MSCRQQNPNPGSLFAICKFTVTSQGLGSNQMVKSKVKRKCICVEQSCPVELSVMRDVFEIHAFPRSSHQPRGLSSAYRVASESEDLDL